MGLELRKDSASDLQVLRPVASKIFSSIPDQLDEVTPTSPNACLYVYQTGSSISSPVTSCKTQEMQQLLNTGNSK